MNRWIVSISGLLLAGLATASDSYLCVTDMAVGFSYNKFTDRWERANFGTDSKKYIISKPSTSGVWEVKTVGNSYADAECGEGFNEYGNIVCEGFTEFRMNKTNGRFLRTYQIGYWNVNKQAKAGDFLKEGDDTPSMEIGKCSPL